MQILHYSLGFPPFRTGGLTKYCMDIMAVQKEAGHSVYLLWPGQMWGGRTTIRKRKPVNGINSLELVNPLPVSYDEGIKDIRAFTKIGNKQFFLRFLSELSPDVIHVHTLMGLYSSFVEASKELGIRTVFTTHDFFPICPKVTLYRHGKICRSGLTCLECPQCNGTALSLTKIRLLQSNLYQVAKDMGVVKQLRKRHRDTYLNEINSDSISNELGPNDYLMLKEYYLSMLANFSVIHYNSTIAQRAYEEVFKDFYEYRIIPITHSAIKDHRMKKKFADDCLRIRYLGPQAGVKGYTILKQALDMLWKDRQNFCLDIHFEPIERSPYMRVHNRYNYSELGDIFRETDVLVAPSIWYETFGYTVLEALSYGVPVIISDTVGAKDILADGAGIVINGISAEKLFKEIKLITPKKLLEMNSEICKKQHIMEIAEMEQRMENECYQKCL